MLHTEVLLGNVMVDRRASLLLVPEVSYGNAPGGG